MAERDIVERLKEACPMTDDTPTPRQLAPSRPWSGSARAHGIVLDICRRDGVAPEAVLGMRGRTRAHNRTTARIVFLLRSELELSFLEIRDVLGRTTHSALHAMFDRFCADLWRDDRARDGVTRWSVPRMVGRPLGASVPRPDLGAPPRRTKRTEPVVVKKPERVVVKTATRKLARKVSVKRVGVAA